jgi:protease PrsW
MNKLVGSLGGRRGLWQANLALIALLLLFVGGLQILAPLLAPVLSGQMLVLAGVVVALVPALIWLAFFYLQDRLEPEPRSYLARVFLLGALVAMAVGIPLVRDLIGLNRWLYTSWWVHLLGSILVVGVSQEFLILATVRLSVYGSTEFDERGDGIVYATAAALGFATIVNLDYVIGRSGVDLGVGAIRVTVNALALASISGVLGYFLGQAKFEHKHALYLPAGLAVAALLNGLFFFTQDVVTLRQLSVQPLYGLLLAAVLAIALLVVVARLMRSAETETVSLSAGGGSR